MKHRDLKRARPNAGFRARAILSAVALSLAFSGTVQADESWIELKAPGSPVIVVTDAGEKTGRKIALQLGQFDLSLQSRFSWLLPVAPSPVTVFVSANESTVRSLAPDPTGANGSEPSSYLDGPTHPVGAVRADLPEPGDRTASPLRGYYRGRVAYRVDQSLGRSLPSWLRRGLVTFFADTVVKEREVLTGRVSLGEGQAAPLPAPSASEFFREGRGGDDRFDLQAGFFVHYLLVGEGGRNAPLLETLLRSKASRAPEGETSGTLTRITALYAGFPKYLASKKFPPLKLSLDPNLRPSSFEAMPLLPADALMLRAEILFELNRPVDTRGLLRQARAADATRPRPLEMEAVLFEREGRSAEARQAIEEAARLGSVNPALYYRLAQMQWSRGMSRPVLESVEQALKKATDLSSEDGNALAYRAEVEGDLGLYVEALDSARRAAALQAGGVYAQMALARALWNAGQADEAQKAARRALGLATLASEKQSVQAFLTFSSRNRKSQARPTRPYLTQFGPPPAGAFGVTRSAASPGGPASPVSGLGAGGARAGSADAAAIADCFARREDAACARAVPALEASCDDKQSTSCVSLGSLYDGGFGVARDRRKAATAYRSACALADKAGCARFAVLEAQGLGVTGNPGRARKTLEGLCAEGVPEGCIGLAQILQRTGYATDRDRAQSLLQKVCRDGVAEACGLVTTR